MSQLNSQNQILTWRKNVSSLTVVTIIFLLWGLITVLNGVMADTLVGSADLPQKFQDPHAMEDPAVFAEFRNLIQFRKDVLAFVFFGVYLIFAYPAGRIVKALGYKKAMISGLSILAIGCISVVGTALVGGYYAFIVAMSLLGIGITLLQVAANPYVVFVSSPETAASRLTFVQAFNSLGTFIAPAMVSLFAFNSIGDLLGCQDMMAIQEAARQSNAHMVIFPYLILALVFIVASIMVSVSNLPEASAIHLEGEPNENEKKSAWQYPHLIFAAVAIFAYVGAEVAIGANLENYYTEVQKNTGDSIPFDPSLLIYIYFGGAILGRLFGAYLLKVNESHNLVVLFAVSAAILVFIAFSGHNIVAVYCLTGVGLFNSILFPTIFSLGIRGLGKHSEEGSSIMIMAISGGALIPFIFKLYHDHLESSHIFDEKNPFHHTYYDSALWVPFVCYMAIVFYGLFGYRFKREDSVHFEK